MAPTRKYVLIDGRCKCPDCDNLYKNEKQCSKHWNKVHKPPTHEEFEELKAKFQTIIEQHKIILEQYPTIFEMLKNLNK
jgi:uncharacterized C2H2 Zn-finger protein